MENRNPILVRNPILDDGWYAWITSPVYMSVIADCHINNVIQLYPRVDNTFRDLMLAGF